MDIAIIGAGAIGLSVAWRAAQRGGSVHVFDAERAGHGATRRGIGAIDFRQQGRKHGRPGWYFNHFDHRAFGEGQGI